MPGRRRSPRRSSPHGRLPARPGVRRLITAAHRAGWKLAVASTSAEATVRLVVGGALGAPLAEALVILAGDVVLVQETRPVRSTSSRSRPSGRARNDAIAIEDSRNGLLAASAAGLACVITESYYTRGEDFSEAALVMTSLGDPEAPMTVLCESLEGHARWPPDTRRSRDNPRQRQVAFYRRELPSQARRQGSHARECVPLPELPSAADAAAMRRTQKDSFQVTRFRNWSYSPCGCGAAGSWLAQGAAGKVGQAFIGRVLASPRGAARRDEGEGAVPQPGAGTHGAARGCRGLDRPPRCRRGRDRGRHACASPGDEQGDARDDLRCCGQGAVLAARSLPCQSHLPAARPRRRRCLGRAFRLRAPRTRSPRPSRTRPTPAAMRSRRCSRK